MRLNLPENYYKPGNLFEPWTSPNWDSPLNLHRTQALKSKPIILQSADPGGI